MHRLYVFLAIILFPTPALADEPRYETREQHDPNGIGKFYMGREIAIVMGHQAAGWLERPEREKEEQPAKLIKELNLKPGDAVADIGAGSGYYSFKFSPLVGDKGKVYAVDIQKEMLDLIRKKMKARNITNVIPHMGETKDPKLPEAGIDLIVMIDVYHEFDYPYEMMQAMLKSLKPGGRMVFVEFRMEDEKVPIKLVHKMSEQQVLKEMAVFPQMKHVRTSNAMPWQHIV
ncbi:MAG TPA: methyltransferase domain-containing protein, partial [Gemmataceae bacterium]|nr:methyltransferase domain-containing protein [Gemmataceae bacterium]